jgi:hypothetical protein
MENSTIVTLGSTSLSAPIITFDQEFSEARGRGRARRQKRKMERITARKTRRKARQEGRLEKKKSRVQARTERRTMRADNREQRRAQKAEGKLSRERAQLEQEREFEPEEEPEVGGYDEESEMPEQGGGGYSEDAGYETEMGGGYEEEGGYEDEGEYEDEGGYDEESEFDGDTYEFFSDSEGETPFDYADGSGTKVSPSIQDVANRIEWNKELCCRLKDKAMKGMISPQDARGEIDQIKTRVSELQSCMTAYCNFEGEFVSDADGSTKFMPCERPSGISSARKAERMRAVKSAISNAQNSRNRTGAGKRMVNRSGAGRRIVNRSANGRRAVNRQSNPMESVTNVEMGLSPKMSNQQITIPARMSSANGEPIGVIGIDDRNDFDANVREIKLGVDGTKTTKIPFKPILIGLGVGAIVILALKKFKVF